MSAKRQNFLLLMALVFTVSSCLKKPVLHRENYIPISRNNIKSVCTRLTKSFPEYSCTEYFNSSYHKKVDAEELSILLQKDELKLTYKTRHENDSLFEVYENLLEEIAPKEKGESLF